MRAVIEFVWDDEAPDIEIDRIQAEEICERCALAVLSCDGFRHDAFLCVEFTGAKGIREINRRMRGIDEETDVLSFPAMKMSAGDKSGFLPKKKQTDVKTGAVLLGDMALSMERAVAQAAEYGHSVQREIGYLCAHSVAHLLGYDHMNEKDKAVMRELEERAMKAAKLSREL